VATSRKLDAVDHVALPVSDIGEALDWYSCNFQCEVQYQDDTWALVQFSNIKLALVIPSQHPPHLGLVTSKAADFGSLKPHRDGTRSVYVTDPAGNSLELLAAE
jgi:catechol 2,3-dioxygenase-like lactoylglutathione lyase family enzyme